MTCFLFSLKKITPLIEKCNTLIMGLSTLFMVFFAYELSFLFWKIKFAENLQSIYYSSTSNFFQTIDFVNIISDVALFLVLVFVLLGYYFDIFLRTKNGKVKKLDFSDYLKGKKIPRYAGYGAAIGFILIGYFNDMSTLFSIVAPLFAYLLAYFLPRTFMPVYLKIRFPETFLRESKCKIRKEK